VIADLVLSSFDIVQIADLVSINFMPIHGQIADLSSPSILMMMMSILLSIDITFRVHNMRNDCDAINSSLRQEQLSSYHTVVKSKNMQKICVVVVEN